MVYIELSKLNELEAGYSKRVSNFKKEGVDCITLSYEEYKRLKTYADVGLMVSKLDQDEKSMLTLSELLDIMERE